MSNNKKFDENDANSWFSNNISNIEKNNNNFHYPTDRIIDWLLPFKQNINNILEVGCGSGHRLNLLSGKLEAKGYGIDPSNLAIDYANKNFNQNSIFSLGTSDKLIFEDEKFDLVHLGFFLYLIDRKDYYKSISEICRVLKYGGFLSIIDFDPIYLYKKKYKHNENIFSYKNKNYNVFTALNHFHLVNKYSFSHNNFYFNVNSDERISLSLLYKEPDPYNLID